eukprot:14073067-Alexandrium_andersonii.AAC.1
MDRQHRVCSDLEASACTPNPAIAKAQSVPLQSCPLRCHLRRCESEVLGGGCKAAAQAARASRLCRSSATLL